MAIIHPAKKLSNPIREDGSVSGRWYVAISPLIHPDFVPKRGKFKKGELEKLLEEVKEDAANVHLIRPLDLYCTYNVVFLKKLPKLKKRPLIITNEMSINRTNPENVDVHPAYFGTDPFTVYNTLTSRIIDIGNELFQENPEKFTENIEGKILFLPMGPIPFPYEFVSYGEEVRIRHALADAVELTNEIFSGEDKLTFGTIEKGPRSAGQITNYEWSDLQLMAPSVKKVDIGFENRFIEKVCYLNRQMMADAYDHLLEMLEIKKFYKYATEGSYVSKVCSMFPDKKYGENNFGVVMRDGKMKGLKECDPSALEILKGTLRVLGGYLD